MKKKVLAVLLGGCMVVGMLQDVDPRQTTRSSSTATLTTDVDQEIPRDIISKLL